MASSCFARIARAPARLAVGLDDVGLVDALLLHVRPGRVVRRGRGETDEVDAGAQGRQCGSRCRNDTDTRLRRVFTTTITLRNRAVGS